MESCSIPRAGEDPAACRRIDLATDQVTLLSVWWEGAIVSAFAAVREVAAQRGRGIASD